jgi:Fe-S cluster assembly protein SufD
MPQVKAPKLNYQYGLGVGFAADSIKPPFFAPIGTSQAVISGDPIYSGRADLAGDPRLLSRLNRLSKRFAGRDSLSDWLRSVQAGGLAFVVPPRLKTPQSVRVFISLAGEDRRRVVVRVGAGSHLNLTLVQNGSADLVTLIEAWVEPGATLNMFRVQDLQGGTVVARVQTVVEAGGHYSHAECLFGGDYVSSLIQGDLVGAEASLATKAIVVGEGQERFDLAREAVVRAPGGRVDLQAASVLLGQSQVVDRSRITIPAGQAGSVAQQQADALLLSPQATYASQPELEVAEAEVECGHASAVGSLDPDKLFYLMSRGLTETAASRQLVQGFLDPTLQAMRRAGLREMVNCLVAKRFGLDRLDC